MTKNAEGVRTLRDKTVSVLPRSMVGPFLGKQPRQSVESLMAFLSLSRPTPRGAEGAIFEGVRTK